MGTEEKRADPRAPFVLRVNFRDRTDCLDATENLSRGGLFVQTHERFTVGIAVGFVLVLAGSVLATRRSQPAASPEPAATAEPAPQPAR